MGEGEGGDCAPKNVPSSSSEVVASAAAASASLDAPAKKLARQLDFTGAMEQLLSQPQQQSVTQQPVTVLPLPPQQAPHPSVRVG
ncbi:hypothetical protein SESBI_15162 [Sesbania bispinosa]|nr:hypothetical protein SESBI_15162 [Sesbania bispinosa]